MFGLIEPLNLDIVLKPNDGVFEDTSLVSSGLDRKHLTSLAQQQRTMVTLIDKMFISKNSDEAKSVS